MLWYPIPGFPLYAANWDGQIKNIQTEKILRTYSHGKDSKRRSKIQKLQLSADKQGYKVYAHRVVLSAKLGRLLEPWEDCRHMDGDPLNNRMDNLEPGCRLNNIIDEYELGRLKTSKEQILIAIERLQDLYKRL